MNSATLVMITAQSAALLFAGCVADSSFWCITFLFRRRRGSVRVRPRTG